MTNRLFSALAVTVLIFALFTGTALAEENPIYPFDLGSYTVGAWVDVLLVDDDTVSLDCSSGSIPYGLYLADEAGSGSEYHYLRGNLQSEGSYSFDISVRNNDGSVRYILRCYLTAYSAAPAAPETPSVSCSQNVTIIPGFSAEVSVSAYVSDGGTLSYQWYDGSGYPISGGTGSALAVMPDTAGTYYYFCAVTNSTSGGQVTVNSQYISVTVSAPTVSSISIRSLPTKTEYLTGETLNTSGLQLAVRYDNGSYDYITTGFEVSAYTFYTPGNQNITVSYQGCYTNFSVTVKDAAKTVTGISVASWPTKTSYTVGEYLDTTGLVLRVYTAAGSYDTSTGYTLSPNYLSNQGNQTITVSYQGFTTTFNVTVNPEEKTGMTIGTMPTRLTYSVGDQLDTTGLVLSVYTGSRKQDISYGFTCSPTTMTKTGVQEITVTYNGLSCTFRVTVNGGEPAHNPAQVTPTPTPAPGNVVIGNGGTVVTPAPTEEPVIISTVKTSPEPSSSGSGPKTAVVVVLIISIVALGGLCGYAYIVDRKKQAANARRKRTR